MVTAKIIFHQTNGELTKAYYARLNASCVAGELAVALFRAQKRSEAAKSYRGGKYRRSAYDVKNWSLSEICRIAPLLRPAIAWGWKHDPHTLGYEWVLYVELPSGQVSFHSAERLSGPDYLGEYDGQKLSRERILAYCDSVLLAEACPRIEGTPAPAVQEALL